MFRIAVVGDSFTEAIHVNVEDTFARLLEQQLVSAGEDVEVLNFGVSGFGTAQELRMLRHYVLPRQPDLVILAIFTGNDIGDNSEKITSGQIKPYYELVNGNLVLDDSFKSDPRFVRAKSWSVQAKASLINSSRGLQLVISFIPLGNIELRKPGDRTSGLIQMFTVAHLQIQIGIRRGELLKN